MSVDLGSAHGSIVLDSSQVLRGAREAASAIHGIETNANQAGRHLSM